MLLCNETIDKRSQAAPAPMNRDELKLEIEALHGASFAWAMTCCEGRREEAEDVLQTTYLKILDGRARFDGRSSLKTWLFAVIRRTAADRSRRLLLQARRLSQWASGQWVEQRQEGAGAATPEEHLDAAQREARIRRGLRCLSPRQRRILELVFYHDLSIRQAADILGVRLGTARVHYERGKKALSTTLRSASEKEDEYASR